MTKIYICLRGCQNDKKNTRFEVGDEVTESDFSKKVISGWLKSGVLMEQTEEYKEDTVESGGIDNG